MPVKKKAKKPAKKAPVKKNVKAKKATVKKPVKRAPRKQVKPTVTDTTPVVLAVSPVVSDSGVVTMNPVPDDLLN